MTTRAKEIRELGNTGFLELDANGKLGIGESNPQRSVVVKGANSSTTSIQFQTPATGSAASDGFGVGYDSNGKGFIWNYESSDTYIGGTTSGTAVTITSAGVIQGANNAEILTSPIRKHSNTISTNTTIASTENAIAGGPINVATGVTLTIDGNFTVV